MYSTEALILNRISNGEADELVSFYTKDFGKLVIKAKGAKNFTTKQGNFLHELSVVRISFIFGRRFYILSGINNIKTYSRISQDFLAIGYISGFFLLCDKLFYENYKDEEMWYLLNKVFEDTEKAFKTNELASALWYHEKSWILSMLSSLGLISEKLEVQNIKSKRQLDKYINNLLEGKIEHFGMRLNAVQ